MKVNCLFNQILIIVDQIQQLSKPVNDDNITNILYIVTPSIKSVMHLELIIPTVS